MISCCLAAVPDLTFGLGIKLKQTTLVAMIRNPDSVVGHFNKVSRLS
jgi:hypothetical protein